MLCIARKSGIYKASFVIGDPTFKDKGVHERNIMKFVKVLFQVSREGPRLLRRKVERLKNGDKAERITKYGFVTCRGRLSTTTLVNVTNAPFVT